MFHRLFVIILTLNIGHVFAESATPDVPAKSVSPSEASVFFISPKDGQTLNNPITVKFGLEGMDVSPAGKSQPNAGHHHLLIDTDLPALDAPVPSDENHKHFGKGQTETELVLSPGKHRLRLLLGDHLHRPHQPPVFSDEITILVK
jgi:uncharacterized protein DUF4399